MYKGPVLRSASARRLLGRLVLAGGFAAASPTFAVCGNGVLDAGEQCDTSATGGDATCPRACIPPGPSGQCTCARPSTEVRQYVAVGRVQLRLSANALVGSGNVAAVAPG